MIKKKFCEKRSNGKNKNKTTKEEKKKTNGLDRGRTEESLREDLDCKVGPLAMNFVNDAECSSTELFLELVPGGDASVFCPLKLLR